MREMHLLNKATVMIGMLLLTPILIWLTNRGDKKEQDEVDEIIMRGKGGEPSRDSEE